LLAYLDGFASIPFGQTSPLVAFAVTLAGYGLLRRRAGAVFAGAALSMIVPYIGLPVCCAIFLWRPAARVGIVAIGLILGAISVLALGLPISLEYLRVELPAHAAAEGTTAIQYSAAWLLHALGVGDALALRIAGAQYVAFTIAAIALAGVVERRLASAAAIALFPAAVAVVGGSFVHIQQMAAALPFAILLAAWSGSFPAWFAVALLAVPWPAGPRLVLAGACAIIVAVVLTAAAGRRPATAAGITLAAIAAYVVIGGPVMTRLIPTVPQRVLAPEPPQPPALDGSELASTVDGREVRADPIFAVSTPRTLAAKLPVWLALGIVIVLSLVALPARRLSEPART
jgi:hypothetical protein